MLQTFSRQAAPFGPRQKWIHLLTREGYPLAWVPEGNFYKPTSHCLPPTYPQVIWLLGLCSDCLFPTVSSTPQDNAQPAYLWLRNFFLLSDCMFKWVKSEAVFTEHNKSLLGKLQERLPCRESELDTGFQQQGSFIGRQDHKTQHWKYVDTVHVTLLKHQ